MPPVSSSFLPEDVLDTVQHGFARVHGQAGKVQVVFADGLDMRRNAVFHRAVGHLVNCDTDAPH